MRGAPSARHCSGVRAAGCWWRAAEAPGSIGLYAAGLAVALSASDVTYLDWEEGRRELATAYGVSTTIDIGTGLPEELPGPYDVAVDASGNPDALRLALRNTAANGICTCTAGAIYAATSPCRSFTCTAEHHLLHRLGPHPTAMHHPLALIADGTFDPTLAITRTVSFDEAPSALVEPFTKLVITRDGSSA